MSETVSTEAVMRGVAKMEANGWCLVRVNDWWAFFEPHHVPENPESGTAIITSGGIYRMGTWNSPAEALADIGSRP